MSTVKFSVLHFCWLHFLFKLWTWNPKKVPIFSRFPSGLFSHGSAVAVEMAMSVCQQILDGLERFVTFVTFMSHSGWNVINLLIRQMFILRHQLAKTLICSIFWFMTNYLQTNSIPISLNWTLWLLIINKCVWQDYEEHFVTLVMVVHLRRADPVNISLQCSIRLITQAHSSFSYQKWPRGGSWPPRPTAVLERWKLWCGRLSRTVAAGWESTRCTCCPCCERSAPRACRPSLPSPRSCSAAPGNSLYSHLVKEEGRRDKMK